MGDGLIGRDPELAVLQALATDAAGGRGAVVVVRGVAGVGKTWLVDHLVGGLSGWAIAWGTAREAGAPALWPWRQAARDLPGTEFLEAIGHDGAAQEATAGGHERFLRFDELALRLRASCAGQPVAIVLDDLQWADDDSVELLDFVAADVRRAPLLIVGTERAGDGSAALARFHAATRARVVDLDGLGTEAVRRLIEVHGGGDPGPSLAAEVTAHTDGNPLFVREIARLIQASTRTSVDGDGHPDAWRRWMPEAIRAVLARRLARVPDPTAAALTIAAVLGPDLDVAVMAQVAGVARQEMDATLDPAVTSGLLVEQADGRRRFAHALIRDAALAGAGPTVLRQLHHRAALALADTAGDRAAGAIAEHFAAAGEDDDARAWCVRAAHDAARDAMYADATRWLDRALALADGLADAERVELLLDAAAAAERAGRHEASLRSFGEVATLARRLGLDEAFGRAVLGLGTVGGGFEVRLLDAGQLALLDEALERTAHLGPSSVRARLLARLSIASTLHVGIERRLELADAALAMADSIGDAAAIVHALGASCDCRAGPTGLPERIELSQRMLATAVQSGDPELELLARRYCITALMERGAVAAAHRQIEDFARLADRVRQPQFRWFARLMEAMLAHLHGDLERAEERCDLAIADGRLAASANAEMLAAGSLRPILRRDRGDLDGFRRAFLQANAGHPEATRGTEPSELLLLGHGADEQAVARVLAELDPDEVAGEHDALHLQVMTLTVLGDAMTGDAARAHVLADRLAPFADHFVLDGTAAVCYGPAALFLGRAYTALGRRAEAIDMLGRALDLLRAVDAPLLVASAQRALAEADAATGHAPRPMPAAEVFRRDGDTWLLTFAGGEARLTDAKGLRDLAALLARPSVAIHVLDLVGDAAPTARLGPALDATARRNYEERIRELTADLDDAEACHDLGRIERLDTERDRLLVELAQALGLGGRDRAAGPDPAERARKAVGMRIRASIDRIDRQLPALGRHLRASVRTGLWCSYEPEHPVQWKT